ncbi:MAG: TetR family transcriptional regulator [SAR86 cluster bacterium]|uniref:TetR family transcriptional regulator n=1 Tax=SAR86 cluster bacterium TaxID=2030880 RepID=A0A2A5B8R5_9GAMM|nr:MAG: TetR family transcriptional regulator [SAR86 cluster bacterium]
MPTKAEKTEATQKKILKAARKVFATHGYTKAALAEIVSKAGVTTGAIYHHFGDKKGLFIAVAMQLEQLILDESNAAIPASGSSWEKFTASIMATLEICARPDIQRIVFRDAPSVVGLFEWRKIEIQFGFGVMQKSLAYLAEKEIISITNPDLTAQMVLGALMEASHFAAIADNKAETLKQGQELMLKVLNSLK